MAEPLRASATAFKQSVGKYLDAARTGRVIIERQGRPTAVLLSIEEYERLDPSSGRLLDFLSGQFDSLVAEMEKPSYSASMDKAFEASPEELGTAFQRGRRRRARG